MPKREEDDVVSETGNWNVAGAYSKLKIMKPLYLCDEYYETAKFGYASFVEQIQGYGMPTDELRLRGFERLIASLILVIDNSCFAVKDAKDKKLLLEFKSKLQKIESLIPKFYNIRVSQVKKTREFVLEQSRFQKALDIVAEIKRQLNEPLNRSHLIFTDKEEFDPVKYKKEIMKQATTRG